MVLQNPAEVEQQICDWIETIVIGLELCPFARRPYDEQSVKIAVCQSSSELQVLQSLEHELTLLSESPAEQIETTLLVLTEYLQDFIDFNQFLGAAEQLLQSLDLQGELQIASFHPGYRFAGTDEDDAENLTNRSPYPVLHLLREASIERAVASFPQVEQIPPRNIQKMNNLTTEQIQRLFPYLF